MPTTPCPVTAVPDGESLSGFPIGPLQILEGRYGISTPPFLLQAEQPRCSQPVCMEQVLQSSDQLCGLIWAFSNSSLG